MVYEGSQEHCDGGRRHQPGDWIWLPATRQVGQVVTKSRLWGTEVVEVWLSAQGTTVRVIADQVESLARFPMSAHPAELVSVAAAARIADAPVAPLEEKVIQEDEKLLMYYDVATMRLGME